jgi:phosphoenolpyruvate carboxylase
LGTAVEKLRAELPEQWQELPNLYHHWPFFRATIDNAALALAKTNLAVAEHYLRLADASTDHQPFAGLITDEYARGCAAVRYVTGQADLLDDVSWLQSSIKRRSPFVDALNLLQIEMLSRLRAAEGDDTPDTEEWAHLVRLTIQGVAAGMRTTG